MNSIAYSTFMPTENMEDYSILNDREKRQQRKTFKICVLNKSELPMGLMGTSSYLKKIQNSFIALYCITLYNKVGLIIW